MNNIEKVQKLLNKGEAFLCKNPANRYYLTGFNSSAGYVFVCRDFACFVTDFRYIENAQKIITVCKSAEGKSDTLAELLKENNINILYTEPSYLSVAEFDGLQNRLSVTVSASEKIEDGIISLRSVKSSEEIEKICKAQEMTDRTFSYILNEIKSGRTERDCMLSMEFYMRKLGSEGVSFDFIFISGKNTSLPHGVPTDKKIEIGDFVTMDFGAVYEGYRSDMTRTVAVGSVTDEMKKVYNTVLSAQKAAMEKIRAGVPCNEVDAAARNLINNSGYEGMFGHGLGHSVGIEIHESPACNTRDTTVLKENMIMTVEPGIYIPSHFGVRIEDMVIVKENGFEDITQSRKDLIIL